jgi:hypothetical protein
MKKIIIIFLIALLPGIKAFSQGHNSNGQQMPDKPTTAVTFKEVVYNFKEMEYGTDISHSFIFTNTSKAPVSVKDVAVACGCTTTDYTKGPIMPGKSGSVSVKYDSSRVGYFAKTVTVKINEETFILTILGTVKPSKTDDNTTPQNH